MIVWVNPQTCYLRGMHDILEFWFGTAELTGRPTADAQARWFGGGPAFDAVLRERYGALLDAPAAVAAWADAQQPAGTLAAILVFDQLPRNIFRGTARAFATDPLALQLARHAVATGQDIKLGLAQCVFLYLPFQHAEDVATQAESIALYTQLVARANDPSAANYLNFAKKHQEIILRFGRFPGRNDALGRPNTPEEDAWLNAGGETFGQR